MIVSLDKAYRSELLFLPAKNGRGKLIGLEISTHFLGADDGVRTPTSLVLSRLSAEDEVSVFEEKLRLLESCQLFFIQQQLIAWINITPAIVGALAERKALAEWAARFSFLELTVAENYPNLANINDTHLLFQIASQFPLMLANFGAGDTSTQAAFSGLFKRIMLDKNFIQKQAPLLSFEPFMRAITAQVGPCSESLLAAGVDTEWLLQRLEPWGFSAYQGALWPSVDAASLISLVQE